MSSDSGSLSPPAPDVSSSTGGSGRIMFIVIAMFLVLALFIAFFYIQTVIGNCLGRLLSPLVSAGIASATDNQNQSRNLGLELEQISCLPTFTYQPIKIICHNKGHEHNEKVSVVECSVCLAELEEGETVRVLPACKHYFHVKCIDMWLSTRSSCPVCRAHPEPEKVQQGLICISPPWRLMYSSSLERQQFRIGSCLSSPFAKTPRNHKSPSPLGTSPFHGSWIGSPSMSTPPWDLHQILVEAQTPEVLEMRQIS